MTVTTRYVKQCSPSCRESIREVRVSAVQGQTANSWRDVVEGVELVQVDGNVREHAELDNPDTHKLLRDAKVLDDKVDEA